MSRLPSLKRDEFLRALGRLGVVAEAARSGGSLIKLRRGSLYDSFHIHPNEEVGPRLAARIQGGWGSIPRIFDERCDGKAKATSAGLPP